MAVQTKDIDAFGTALAEPVSRGPVQFKDRAVVLGHNMLLRH